MSNISDNNAAIDFRLPAEVKHVVEQAAALRGQSLDDFAVSTIVENAQRVILQHQVTELSNRDRDIFLTLLDNDSSEPTEALLASAESYKEWVRRNER
jgi:uncharacterized protein (DUF1778 family)